MKLKTLYREYKTTEVLEGSPVAFFFFFWTTKLMSLLQRKSEFLNGLIHKVFANIPQPEFVIKNKGGVFVVQPFDDSTTICSDYFEKDIRDWLLTPRVKNLFVDIGANRGIYSVIAPIHYGYQKVHAFEPNIEVFNTLEENVRRNNLADKVECHNLAAGKETSTLPFTVDPMHKGGGRIVPNSAKETFDVMVEPLDITLKAVLAEQISFVKIDTEGYEFDVLAGMPDILSGMTNGSCLMVESMELDKLVTFLSPYGFNLKESKYNDHLLVK